MTRCMYIAVVVLAVAAAPALALDIQNPSFEDFSQGASWVSGIVNWTPDPPVLSTDQRVGLFFNQFNYYDATDGLVFANVQNLGDGAQAITSDYFVIGNFALNFDFAYLTENAGAQAPANDPFTVTLGSSPDGVAGWTITTFTVTNTSTASLSPIPNSSFQGTDWDTYQYVHNIPLGYVAFVSFTIEDDSTGDGTSGFLLDNLSQVPEPGTFALFGAGFLGIAFFARRKHRKKAV